MEKRGALALDCDEIYHNLLAENEEMKIHISTHFEGVFVDGEIDRKRLGEIVFNDKGSLQKLNKITHKYVVDEVKERISEYEAKGGRFAAIDAIALIESGAGALCDKIVGIIAPVDKRISRIMERDGISRERAQMRIDAQMPDSFFIENCDEIIENTFDTLEEFENACKILIPE